MAANDYHHAEDWLRELVQLQSGGMLAQLLPQEGFAVSAYRMSLLGLIGDPGAENRNGVSAEMAQLPLHWRVEPVFEPVARCGVAYMSRSRLEPRQSGVSEAVDASPSHGEPSYPRRRGSTHPDTAKPVSMNSRLGGNDGTKQSRKRHATRKTSEPA